MSATAKKVGRFAVVVELVLPRSIKSRPSAFLNLLLKAAGGVRGEIRDWSAVCRVCGCTQWAACDGGCSWVEDDLCSECIKPAKRRAA